jgi:hypothetical protein
LFYSWNFREKKKKETLVCWKPWQNISNHCAFLNNWVSLSWQVKGEKDRAEGQRRLYLLSAMKDAVHSSHIPWPSFYAHTIVHGPPLAPERHAFICKWDSLWNNGLVNGDHWWRERKGDCQVHVT